MGCQKVPKALCPSADSVGNLTLQRADTANRTSHKHVGGIAPARGRGVRPRNRAAGSQHSITGAHGPEATAGGSGHDPASQRATGPNPSPAQHYTRQAAGVGTDWGQRDFTTTLIYATYTPSALEADSVKKAFVVARNPPLLYPSAECRRRAPHVGESRDQTGSDVFSPSRSRDCGDWSAIRMSMYRRQYARQS
jgi:hypothetical protein